MAVVRDGTALRVAITATEPVNRHRPSVDVLFDSLVSIAPTKTTAALLTGMGTDGAAGLGRLHAAGARTVAQDERSCVVFGMPREAIRLNAADVVLPLDQIGAGLIELSRRA
jgi:two-component system chemotaxis response regulator CheB